MAIDAKDQVTHGHIRRVQAHATSLAKEVESRRELTQGNSGCGSATRHGEIGCSEYILNKPGKLTDAEFQKRSSTPASVPTSLPQSTFPIQSSRLCVTIMKTGMEAAIHLGSRQQQFRSGLNPSGG
jgi:hypothetical protein